MKKKRKLRENYEVIPEFAYRGDVVKSGSGAVIKSFKKFLGKKAIVIIEESETREFQDMMSSTSPKGWKKTQNESN